MVRITDVETIRVRVPLSVPTGPAGAFNAARQALVVRITTDAGVTGWGETYAVAGVRSAIDLALKPLLIGRDPTEVRALHQSLLDATFDNGFAVGGVDVALHDVCGKLLGVPITGLYGGAVRDRVPVYASGFCYQQGVNPADAWPAEARQRVAEGYSALKLRVGRFNPATELALLAVIRAETPSSVRMMVDAWGSYTAGDAVRVGRELERMGFMFFEEPLPQARGYAGYEDLARALDIPIAGGETLQTRASLKALLDRRAVDIVQPDVAICGGIGDTLFVSELAALMGIPCLPHSWNGAIMTAATLHVAALLPEATRVLGAWPPLLEFDTTENPLATRLVCEPPRLEDGCFRVPTAPGLGLEVDEAWIRAHAVES
jgi:D-galactarolactone cycloisomerase